MFKKFNVKFEFCIEWILIISGLLWFYHSGIATSAILTVSAYIVFSARILSTKSDNKEKNIFVIYVKLFIGLIALLGLCTLLAVILNSQNKLII